MKAKISIMVAALLLCAGAAQAASGPKDSPPSNTPPPKLNISTMLFLMLGQNEAAANTSDPIDINAFDIDFGDDADEMLAAIDAVLQGK
jgi:hypothetical protein